MTSLDGMRLLLCRDRDALKTKTAQGPCCRNLAYYMNGKLWCADCKRPRGRLPPKVIDWLSVVISTFPGMKNETHILRPDDDDDDGMSEAELHGVARSDCRSRAASARRV